VGKFIIYKAAGNKLNLEVTNCLLELFGLCQAVITVSTFDIHLAKKKKKKKKIE